MAKRQLQNDHDETDSKAQFAQRHTIDADDVEMGEFEDRWEDEFEEEEEAVEGDDLEEDIEEEDEDEGSLSERGIYSLAAMEGIEADSEVYLPSKPMDKDHILMPDLSAYDMLHSMSVQWPFLSFDIIKDQLGDERRNVTLCLFAG
jgi:ribosome assembly protein RRB1